MSSIQWTENTPPSGPVRIWLSQDKQAKTAQTLDFFPTQFLPSPSLLDDPHQEAVVVRTEEVVFDVGRPALVADEVADRRPQPGWLQLRA